MTPSSKYDFKFKDYAPWAFRAIRDAFHVDPAEYLVFSPFNAHTISCRSQENTSFQNWEVQENLAVSFTLAKIIGLLSRPFIGLNTSFFAGS